MNWRVELTKACKVPVEHVLVASKPKVIFERSHSAREIAIVSAAGEVGLWKYLVKTRNGRLQTAAP